MFVDKVNIVAQAGNGGDGLVSFRREKFVDRGGPDGGDGGDGGDILVVASRNQNTLAAFRYKRTVQAASGEKGGKRNCHGKNGQDLIIKVPVGTLITTEAGEVVADLIEDGEQTVVAFGGKGGFGNAHFTSSTRQAPRVAEKGEKGDILSLTLELKMIADVGLVGLPNAGKSTLLASVSNARPEIADYPFTTLTPNLGVVDIDHERSILLADIPGLIEGASIGKGLGDEFLRHVERTAVLLHLIDVYDEDIVKSFHTVQKELRSFKVNLAKRPQVVAINKTEGLDVTMIQDSIDKLQRVVPSGTKVVAISGHSKQGVPELLFLLADIVRIARRRHTTGKSLPVIALRQDDSWHIKRTPNGFLVTGRKIEKFAARTDFANPYGVSRLRDIMQKMGIMKELSRQGIQPGEKIKIGEQYGLDY